MIIGPVGIRYVREKESFWKDFSKEVSGEFKLIRTIDKVFNRLQIKIEQEGIQKILTETDTKPLKIQIELENLKTDFRFEVYPADIMDKIIGFFTSSILKTNKKFRHRKQTVPPDSIK